jgi:flavin-dependent dehydrogenase
MHVRSDGYIGIAPLPGDLANVCVVRALDGAHRPQVDAQRLVVDAIQRDPMLRDRFARARQVDRVTTLGPLAVDSTGSGVPGLLLAGDAAGFIDPMTGDGLRFALRGGVLAAEAVLSELSSGLPAHRWLHAARAAEFAGKWRFNRALRALSSSPAAIAVVAGLTSLWDAPVRSLISVAGDIAVARGSSGQVAPPRPTRDEPVKASLQARVADAAGSAADISTAASPAGRGVR